MAKAAAAKTVTVTAKQIAQTLAEKHELQKKSTIALFDDFFAAITKSLKKGERVRMGDIGILQVRKRAARMGRNPQTGEPIKIKASKKVAFRASKVLKEAI
jgi:DNA-binding protein HU-beta